MIEDFVVTPILRREAVTGDVFLDKVRR
jgi:hypothetical protein